MNTRSRHLAITSYDGPSALELQQRPIPQPGAGQVLIRVSHAGIGFVDGLFARGFGQVALPHIPGLEAAGTVVSLGDGVADLTIGQSVAALLITTGGGYAEHVLADARLVTPIPEGMDPAIAAATCTNTVTALAALGQLGPVEGARVLVHAAAGGVGAQFGQVARHLGAATVVGVVGSESKRTTAMALGYDQALLRQDLPRRQPGGWDLIIDPVGGEATAHALDQLAPMGTLLRVGNASGADAVAIDSMALWLQSIGVRGFNLGAFTTLHPERAGTHLRRAIDLVGSGAVAVDVTRRVSFDEASVALGDVLAGRSTGKAVIELG